MLEKTPLERTLDTTCIEWSIIRRIVPTLFALERRYIYKARRNISEQVGGVAKFRLQKLRARDEELQLITARGDVYIAMPVVKTDPA